MIKLTERLQRIASQVDDYASAADIGTDHGYIPIYLYQVNNQRKIIMTDINEGPLKIAEKNMMNYGVPTDGIEKRQGSGLEPVGESECNTLIIAGMGGILISEILEKDFKKSHCFKKIILQPRNSQDKLRKWLLNNHFKIDDEFLVKEGKFICEIIITSPSTEMMSPEYTNDIYYEIGKKLIDNQDPLLKEFIINKINIEKKICHYLENKKTQKAEEQLKKSLKRISSLQEVLYHEAE